MTRLILIATSASLVAATAGADHRYQRDDALLHAADALAYATHRTHETAEHYAGNCARDDSRHARKALRKLDHQARKFFDRAARSNSSGRTVNKSFRRLIDRYYTAWHAVHDLRDAREIERSFLRVQRAMDRLVANYGGYGAYGHEGCSESHGVFFQEDDHGAGYRSDYGHRPVPIEYGNDRQRYSERSRGGRAGGWFRWRW